jgi:hypothetical protein
MRLSSISVLVVGVLASQSAISSEDTEYAEAIVRYELSTGAIAPKSTLCISIAGHDVPASFITHIQDTGLKISLSQTGCDRRIPFGQPQRRKDGTFEVSYGYFGPECANCPVQGRGANARMRQDKDGWHVIDVYGGVSS